MAGVCKRPSVHLGLGRQCRSLLLYLLAWAKASLLWKPGGRRLHSALKQEVLGEIVPINSNQVFIYHLVFPQYQLIITISLQCS